LTNYSGVAITISLNGEWLRQLDKSVDYPQLPRSWEKTNLLWELPSEPKGTVTVNIYANRNSREITILPEIFKASAAIRHSP
jgi:hypothetical protein